MTTRRGFLTGILALGAAPAIVRAESLMRLWVPPQELVIGHIDGFHFIESSVLPMRNTDINGSHPADQFVFFIHPTWEEAMCELIGFGSATVVMSREVLRHG